MIVHKPRSSYIDLRREKEDSLFAEVAFAELLHET